MPNSRQWAVLFWIALLAAWALSRRDVRSSLGDLTRTLAE
jgi:hypothetical protein